MSAALDVRVAQTVVENAVRDAVLLALGRRLPAAASVAALRAASTRGASGQDKTPDDLVNVVAGGVVVTAWRWSPTDARPDDGVAVVKPTDTSGAGRWVAWESPLLFSPAPGEDSAPLHESLGGPLARVILLDKSTSADEVLELLSGEVPAVVVEATDDAPEDATLNVGHRWVTEYRLTVSVVSTNLRDRREAAQGSSVAGDDALGANAVDGLVASLLAGTQLRQVVPGLMGVFLGRGRNWTSELAQRRVVRSRDYRVRCTVENPQAPNEVAAAEGADAQANMTDVRGQAAPVDPTSYVVETQGSSGFGVAEGVGLTKPVAPGSASISGVTVTYVGEVHAFAAWSDTYRDLKPDGTMAFTAVTLDGSPAPIAAAGRLRVGVTRTNTTGVTSDRLLATTYGPYMRRFAHDL